MKKRDGKKWYLFYPEDVIKSRWDIFMTYCLIFTCISTPIFISFHEDEPGLDEWETVNLIVDFFFAMDIIVVFFSAFYDDDFVIIDEFKYIARNYIFGWFFLDVAAITPFD